MTRTRYELRDHDHEVRGTAGDDLAEYMALCDRQEALAERFARRHPIGFNEYTLTDLHDGTVIAVSTAHDGSVHHTV